MLKIPANTFAVYALIRGFILGLLIFSIGLRKPAAASQLDLSQYVMTFDENFSTLNISAYGPGTRWIAHTPWNGDFGDNIFDNPNPTGPFSLTKNGIMITARKDAAGKWHAGLICSEDKTSKNPSGFQQKYGYFEMRAKLPGGPGVWPAFWLVGVDKTAGTSELDVMEFYGHDDASFRSTEHIWVNGKDQRHMGCKFNVAPGLLSTQYNNYGVLIEPEKTTFFFNRQEYWSTPTPPEYQQPFYILANLAIGGGWPIKNLQSPEMMDIEYIHVYQSKAQ